MPVRWIGLFLLGGAILAAQSDECREAFEVRDHIRESMARAKPDYRALHYKVKQQTQQCDLLESLWKLREELALKIGEKADAELAKDRANGKFVIRDREFEALLASTPKQFNPAAPVGRRWALIAGTSVFEDRQIKRLDYGDRDLRMMQDLVTRKLGYLPENVLTAIGKDFTPETFRARFTELREKVAENDLVMVYLLSHSLEGAEDANETSVLLTYKTDASTPKRRYETGIQLVGLVQEVFRELKARRVVLMLDTCFSGDAITGQRSPGGQPSPRFLELLTQNSGRVILAASSADQRSWELPKREHGAFAYCLAEAASQNKGALVRDVFASTETCVRKEVSELEGGHDQRPTIFASEGARRIALSAQ